ncbi:cell envelope integrity protein TolA [bacterium]|nr:cell envelope integrity protein TolA [bacterium]
MSLQADTQEFFSIPRKAIIASLILHAIFPIGWLGVKTLEMLGIELFPRTYVKDVYQEYVQVDLVALPDMAIKDLEKLDPTLPEVEKPEEKIEPKAEAAEDVMELEAKQRAAEKEKAEIAKKKAAEEQEKKKALAKIEEEMKREAALKALAKKEGERGRPKLKGNILSKGTAAVGNLGTPKDQYTSIVMAKIKERFYIMPSQRNRGLQNSVHIELYQTGRVRSKALLRPSKDSLFDSAVLQAIEDSQPLPIPEDLSLIQGGITVTFRAEE